MALISQARPACLVGCSMAPNNEGMQSKTTRSQNWPLCL